MTEINTDKLLSILCSFSISLLMSVENQMEPHSRRCREVKKVEEAIVSLARLQGVKLSERDIEIGVNIWNAAIIKLQSELENE